MLVRLDWDMARYASRLGPGDRGRSTKKNNTMANAYPNPNIGEVKEPATIVDRDGRLVGWYLPGLLSTDMQVSMCRSMVVTLTDVVALERPTRRGTALGQIGEKAEG